MSEKVRVRFAPSPTGKLHIGNARTAILNWLFARHANGVFVLRVEDTDTERSTKESEAGIFRDLRWLGLDWDEGPETGGDFGPYRQKERLHIYKEYTDRLLAEGHAYQCYCTSEELEAARQKALAEGRDPKYNNRCRNLSDEEKQTFAAEGREPVVRLRVPEKDYVFQDIVKGEITFPAGDLGDWVIVRADGVPTYNFAVVIDDALMKITHVVRGDDHVSNTPKQLAVYEALNLPIPLFAHIPMILGEDRTRLSKRHGATSVGAYAERGFLSEALINFLSLLSWSSESGDEILSVERLIEEFDFSRVSKSPAVFDTTKLTWMNGVYIRDLPIAELTDRCLPYLEKAGYPLPRDRAIVEKMVQSVQKSLEVLEDIVPKLAFFFADKLEPEDEETAAWLKNENFPKLVEAFIAETENVQDWNVQIFLKVMKAVAKRSGLKGKNLWMPMRAALTGKLQGPEVPLVAEIYGKEKCVKLLENSEK